MCRYKNQSGQSIVEFAIIFPFFMFMFLGFVYTALLCHDYLTLTTIARDSARALAVGVTEETLRNRYASQTFLTGAYTWSSSKTEDFTITTESENTKEPSAGSLVKVTVTAHSAMEGFDIAGMNFSLPDRISSSLTMHKE